MRFVPAYWVATGILLAHCSLSPSPEWIFAIPGLSALFSNTENPTLEDGISCPIGFQEFWFSSEANYLYKNYSASIPSLETTSITVSLPYGVVPRAVASFETSPPEVEVFVNQVLQQSGVTVQDFSNPILYELRGPNCSRTIQVSVTPIQPVWDTGLKSCFTSTITMPCNVPGSYSQDGDFPTTPHPRAFSKYELLNPMESIVYDGVAGLVWAGCVPAMSPGSFCSTGTLQYYDYGTAKQFCTSILNNFNSGQGYGGYKNWRPPTVQELISIIEREKPTSLHGMVDPATFPNNPGDNMFTFGYWTMTEDPYSAGSNYMVRFEMGSTVSKHVISYAHATTGKIRCVSGGTPPSKEWELVENGKFVLDKKTNLLWTRCASGQLGTDCSSGPPTGMDWYSALQFCVSIGPGWRLPNANEILSLMDFSIPNTGLNPTFFPNAPSGGTWNYWTSTTIVDFPDRAVTLQPDGIMEQDHKIAPTLTSVARCVKSN